MATHQCRGGPRGHTSTPRSGSTARVVSGGSTSGAHGRPRQPRFILLLRHLHGRWSDLLFLVSGASPHPCAQRPRCSSAPPPSPPSFRHTAVFVLTSPGLPSSLRSIETSAPSLFVSRLRLLRRIPHYFIPYTRTKKCLRHALFYPSKSSHHEFPPILNPLGFGI